MKFVVLNDYITNRFVHIIKSDFTYIYNDFYNIKFINACIIIILILILQFINLKDK